MAFRGVMAFVTVLCAIAVTAVHADVNERFEVGIRLRVDRSVTSRRLTERLKTESEAIWEPYGIRLKWTDAVDSEAAAKTVVLDASIERQFEGPERVEWQTVLGRVAVNPEVWNWQPIRVSFDAIERVLAARTRSGVSGAGLVFDLELARALGRVLAHEIGHVLLGAPNHDRAGLMRRTFRSDELAEPDREPFRLTCSGVSRLRSRLRTLSSDPYLARQDDATTLGLEGLPGARNDSPVRASCIRAETAD